MIRCKSHKTFSAFRRHRDSGECPTNAPIGGAFVHWSLTVRELTPKEKVAEEKKRERIKLVASNPIYKANSLAKKEAAKQVRLRMAGGGR